MTTTDNTGMDDFYQQVGRTCTLLLKRQLDEAWESIDILRSQRPDAAEVLYLMGLAAVTLEEYGRGLLFIEEAHNQDPDCFEYSNLWKKQRSPAISHSDS